MVSLIKTMHNYAIEEGFYGLPGLLHYLILLMKMVGKAFINAWSFKETLNLLFTL
jgi:hypothetical protein